MANEFCKTKEDVLKIVREKDVSFIQFWFTDVLGMLKSFSVTPSELEEGLIEGVRRRRDRRISGFEKDEKQGLDQTEQPYAQGPGRRRGRHPERHGQSPPAAQKGFPHKG